MKTLFIEFAIALDDDQREIVDSLNSIGGRMRIRTISNRLLEVSYDKMDYSVVYRILRRSLGDFFVVRWAKK